MQKYYEVSEVVHVLDESCLIDAESYQRRYFRALGKPLARGFYVVRWPAPIQHGRFDEHADFVGPFEARNAACAVRDRLEAEARQTKTIGVNLRGSDLQERSQNVPA
jgi:hypothetical protein